jgi:predicted nucleic acid-binding protein
MTKPILIDTNILVYACDSGEQVRQEMALSLLRGLALAGSGRLSVQMLAEFVNVTTRSKNSLLTRDEALIQATRLAQTYPTFDLTPAIVLEAARAVRDFSLAFYDAQIWACAHLHTIPVIFSEDFQDGQTLEGVRFINPFLEKFSLEKWL